MMVIFVSQCEKKALLRTRKVLDAFADRIGDRTWQTVITQEGLDAVKRQLRLNASKNTAVSCHWIRSRSRSDLLWVVGKKDAFNHQGVVPVNRTKKNVLHNEWENQWKYASSIQIIATIAALLHDIGKTTVGFQNKLSTPTFVADPYRHEWISLKLFELLIEGCVSDQDWLQRFAYIDHWLVDRDFIKKLKTIDPEKTQIVNMPPLAQWVAWLIVSHHRLPPVKYAFYNESQRESFKNSIPSIRMSLLKFYQHIRPVDYWIKNPKTIQEGAPQLVNSFWKIKYLVLNSCEWKKQIKRWANKALKDVSLLQLSEQACADKQPISDPLLLHLSRLVLMIGDHNYSSLSIDDQRCVRGDKGWKEKLVANTDRKTGKTKQALDEHLVGVAHFTAQFARFLPKLTTTLPSLRYHDSLAKNTIIDRFKWQNHAFKLAREISAESIDHGFFGVNMASTGCGKTIGNARIMYGLSDPKQGARFTIALGLRVLTLQTGLSFRKDLKLSDEQLAILVGGTANKKLFEYYQENGEPTGIVQERMDGGQESNKGMVTVEASGSESMASLIDEIIDSSCNPVSYQDFESLNIDTLLHDHKARQLLFSPIVTCTVDHIIQASECKRGGRYIAPMLRLLSSDLILDEPDDFNPEDLPALCRLVHLAGMFGSRILLSSATLTPDMVSGLYQAYLAGRIIYNNSQNKSKPNVVCAWFDEQKKAQKQTQCADSHEFLKYHTEFVKKRCNYLEKQPVCRRAEILPLHAIYHREQKELFYQQVCNDLIEGVVKLHQRYHQIDGFNGICGVNDSSDISWILKIGT